MEITISKQLAQPENHRTELRGSVTYTESKTPSRHVLIEQLAKKQKVDASLVVVRTIEPSFGIASSALVVYVYDTKENLLRSEQEYVSKKNVLPEPEKKEEPVVEAVEEATPAEEKTE